jgi:hypothetical protein
MQTYRRTGAKKLVGQKEICPTFFHFARIYMKQFFRVKFTKMFIGRGEGGVWKTFPYILLPFPTIILHIVLLSNLFPLSNCPTSIFLGGAAAPHAPPPPPPCTLRPAPDEVTTDFGYSFMLF